MYNKDNRDAEKDQRVPGDLVTLALVKGPERYIFIFDDNNPEQRSECLRQMGRYASDPELSFTWFDAATLSTKLRKLSNKEQE